MPELYTSNHYDDYLIEIQKILSRCNCDNIYDGEVEPIPTLADYIKILAVPGGSSVDIEHLSTSVRDIASVRFKKLEGWWISLNQYEIRDKGGVRHNQQDERVAQVNIVSWKSQDDFASLLEETRLQIENIISELSYNIGLSLPNVQIEGIKGGWARRRIKNKQFYTMQSSVAFLIRDIVKYNYPKNLTYRERANFDWGLVLKKWLLENPTMDEDDYEIPKPYPYDS